MSRVKQFIQRSFIGGVLVLAPILVLVIVFRWAFDLLRDLVHPIAHPIAINTGSPEIAIDVLILAMLVLLCFVIGSIVSTGAGRLLHNFFENRLSQFAPGYRLVRDVFKQLLGENNDSPFKKGEVAMVKPFGAEVPTRATAIVTSRHDNGDYSVFVPTGPNPTSGFIYHLPPDCVELRPDIKLDEAFRTVIACGSGTGELFTQSQEALK